MEADIRKDTYRLLFPKEFQWLYELTWQMSKEIYEIRIRCAAPICVETGTGRYYAGTGQVLVKNMQNLRNVSMKEVQLWIQHLCRYSLYAFREELIQGFFTVCGGHRIGVVGQVVWGENGVENLKYISGINIRIAHEIIGCARDLLPKLFDKNRLCSTLIISPPMCGKTTLLRDLIRCISDGEYCNNPLKVGVIDERGEIAACYMGEAQHHIGIHTDVYTNCNKTDGFLRLLRSMSPQVIAMDELGEDAEIHMIEKAFFMGCSIIASAHANGIEAVLNRPLLLSLFCRNKFERVVVLDENSCFKKEVFTLQDLFRLNNSEGCNVS